MIAAVNEARNLLIGLRTSIEERKGTWEELKELNPSHRGLSEEAWECEQAQCWIFGTSDIMEGAELQQWLFDCPPESETAKGNALLYWREWAEYIDEDLEGADIEPCDLPKPNPGSSVQEYTNELTVGYEGGDIRLKRQRRAVDSFFNHLRSKEGNRPNGVAFIETVFPQKRDIIDGRMIRRVPPQAYPLPIELAGQIISQLASLAIEGPAKGRKNAIQALALAWLCLAASRLRHPIYLEDLHKTPASSINRTPSRLDVPTLYGDREIRISRLMAEFLNLVAQLGPATPQSTILHAPQRALNKTLQSAVRTVQDREGKNLGEITFVTFLSPPHYHHRRCGSAYK